MPWVHEKFTVKFTMSHVDGYTIYMHIGCLNCPENVNMGTFGGKMQWGHKYRSARSNVYCPWALFHKTTVFTNLPNTYPPWLLLLCDQATVTLLMDYESDHPIIHTEYKEHITAYTKQKFVKGTSITIEHTCLLHVWEGKVWPETKHKFRIALIKLCYKKIKTLKMYKDDVGMACQKVCKQGRMIWCMKAKVNI